MPHTILLSQYNNNISSKHWDDYDSIPSCMDGVCQMFERQLKKDNPQKKQITYDIQNLYDYIDRLPDISCLVFADKYHVYEPKGKKWIKDQVFKHLKQQANSK
mmetsp:Transcript_75914/g.93221  ORF Transcript_75914/g.93221 Transcript_75914/m.93221 type:complete len:103 (-) Transcript_75914:197-505(-)